MNNWKEVIEGDQVFYINDKLGNILKAGEDVYIAMMPKVIRLGPFKTVEEAKKVLEKSRKTIDGLLDEFNNQLLSKEY